MKLLCFAVLVNLSLGASSYAIYEEDNRKDFYEISNPQVTKVASAVAYQIEKMELQGWTFNRFWTLVMEPLKDRGICEDERFSDQLSLRTNCTAILVSPKHLLTAGNCINDHFCTNDLYYWMFDYNVKTPGPFNIEHHNQNFHRCKKIVKRVFDQNTATSYTLFELKKEVKGVTPVKFRQRGSLSTNEELIVLGHVQGLPLKIADHAQVYDQSDTHFLLNSDISGKTKGAPIINAKTFELEGIMIHGTMNYQQLDQECKNSPHYLNEEAQELALKTSVFKDILNNIKNTQNP